MSESQAYPLLDSNRDWSTLSKEGRRVLVEIIDERVLVRARVRAERPGSIHQDLVRIAFEDRHRFLDELVERHGFFGLPAVHEVSAHPGRSDFQYADAGLPQQEALRQCIGMQRGLRRGIDRSSCHWDEAERGARVGDHRVLFPSSKLRWGGHS